MGFTGKLIIVPTYCEIGPLLTFFAGLKPSLYYTTNKKNLLVGGSGHMREVKGKRHTN